MIDKRINLLVTTIVRVVVEGAPGHLFDGHFPKENGSPLFGPESGLFPKDGKQPRVLVVDDESLIADSVAAILNRNGYAAISRYSGVDAIQSIHEQCPDIIVSDVVMPDLNGIQLAKTVRSICPNARIVLFSGNVDTASLLEDASLEGYFFEILPKPVHPLHLLKALGS
ncbi:MAG TPA: response regulator [Terracidiphilus sp.]|jgi:CheY-like chemotaxis protein|nr:response regulator [Terracidiphilus sp.]